METATKRAVIYCRVSTKEQVDEGNSLVTQEKICREYALKNGYDVIRTFIEQGESAKTRDRTELKKLMAFCSDRRNAVRSVIAYKIDRISRNTDDYSQIRILLKRYNVEIKSTSENFDNTPAGRFMENMLANVGQFDNDVRTERCVNGMKDAAREGRYVWCAPLGYSNLRIAGKATIAPNHMAPLVLKAFTLISQGIPVEFVRKQVKAEGLKGWTGKPVSKAPFYRMISNKIYCGWIHKFGEVHKGLFEPIITEELFEMVQWVLKKRSKRAYAYKRENPDFPLRRFVYNPTGERLTGCWSKGKYKHYAYYRFMKESGNYPKASLEDEFKMFLDSFALDDKHYQSLKKSLKEELCKSLEEKLREANRFKASIEDLKNRQSGLIQKNLQGYVSDTLLKQELDRIDSTIHDSRVSLMNLPDEKIDYIELLGQVKEYLQKPSKIWAEADLEDKQRLQLFEFPKGVVYSEKKFRTPQIASIFKALNDISDSDSLEADSEVVSSNSLKLLTPVKRAKKQLRSTYSGWEKVGEEVKVLALIVMEIKTKTDSLTLESSTL